MGNFNKMEVWKDSKELAIQVFLMTRNGKLSNDFSFRDQIWRAAISIPSNLAEGEESIFDKVSIRFFSIASASLAELRTQIEIARDIGYIEDSDYHPIAESMIILSKRINKLIQFRQKQLK